MGACLAPQNAFLNNLGLETLGLRMQRHCSNAMELAEFLNGLGHGITVSYPGLKEHHIMRLRQNSSMVDLEQSLH